MGTKCSWSLRWKMGRFVSWKFHDALVVSKTDLCVHLQKSKTVQTTLAELQEDNNEKLPPLMNPEMLEASEDLTNLSHLNEPAGLLALSHISMTYRPKLIGP